MTTKISRDDQDYNQTVSPRYTPSMHGTENPNIKGRRAAAHNLAGPVSPVEKGGGYSFRAKSEHVPLEWL